MIGAGTPLNDTPVPASCVLTRPAPLTWSCASAQDLLNLA